MERNDWKIEDGKSENEVSGYIYIFLKAKNVRISQKDDLSLEKLY